MAVTYTFTNGTTADADEVNQNFTDAINASVKMIKLNKFGLSVSGSNILTYSATRWQNVSKLTTDAGATDSSDPYPHNNAAICRANKTKAISWSDNGVDWQYSTDSGATWTVDSTPPANLINGVNCVDYRVDGLIYVAADVASTTGLWYSTDGGDNFTQVAGALDDFVGVGMHDATHGLAVNDAGKIYFTVDGTTWTDSTYTMQTPVAKVDIEISASGASIGDFNALMVVRDSDATVGNYAVGSAYLFDGTANATGSLYHGSDDLYTTATNLYKLTNGAICYAAEYSNSPDGAGNWFGGQAVLYATGDVGLNWYVIPLGPIAEPGGTKAYFPMGDSVSEYDTNKILIFAKLHKLFQIDLGGIA